MVYGAEAPAIITASVTSGMSQTGSRVLEILSSNTAETGSCYLVKYSCRCCKLQIGLQDFKWNWLKLTRDDLSDADFFIDNDYNIPELNTDSVDDF